MLVVYGLGMYQVDLEGCKVTHGDSRSTYIIIAYSAVGGGCDDIIAPLQRSGKSLVIYGLVSVFGDHRIAESGHSKPSNHTVEKAHLSIFYPWARHSLPQILNFFGSSLLNLVRSSDHRLK